MSNKIDIDIKELELKIPVQDFPLKSDIVVGYTEPKLKLQTDECDWDEIDISQNDGVIITWKLENECIVDTYGWFDNLVKIVEKYNGTLVADCTSDDGDIEYIRVRNGKKKKVKVVEEK